MKPVECEFEAEVLAAVLRAGWPERGDADLRAHVAVCAICSDVAAIAGTIDESRVEIGAHAVIPDSGRVWWIAQRRARLEAAEAAARPMTVARVVALACALGLLGAYFGAVSAWFQSALERIASGAGVFDIGERLASATSLLAEHGALALAMVAMLFLLPVAVFLAIGRD